MMVDRTKRSGRKDRDEGHKVGLDCSKKDRKRMRKEHQRVFMSDDDYRLRLQEVLYSPEHILTKIFRKDGPVLGDEFDSLPSNAIISSEERRDSRESHNGKALKTCRRRKVPVHAIVNQPSCDNIIPGLKHGIGKGTLTANRLPFKKHGIGKGFITRNGPARKHGIGKGFITAYQAIHSDDKYCPASPGRETKRKRNRVPQQQSLVRKLAIKEQAKRKTTLRNRKLRSECRKAETHKQPRRGKCEIALEDMKCLQYVDQLVLMDDEELELRELQAGPNPLSCSAHFPTSSSHGCSLCKDLLAKFPPGSVTMKLPVLMQPWVSSPELVNKLFKVFCFLSTYAITIRSGSFTLDDFAQAFTDKDSLLLGQVHLSLLRLLLSDIGKDISSGIFSHASKNHRFLSLLRSLEENSILELWQKSLNPLTWTEILCQIMVAAGFGSKLCPTPKEATNAGDNLMEKYGLSPSTLKGELFGILMNHGNTGMQVSELAKSSSIMELNLTNSSNDLEEIIITALSGDITLFEKISSRGYRLRIKTAEKECEEDLSDSEDFGSVDDMSEVTSGQKSLNLIEYESQDCYPLEVDVGKSENKILTVYNEIDESHPGEMWLLGLMEGEYSDLSVEEKLTILSALIDLVSAGSSIRMEDQISAVRTSTINHSGSGAKIKKSTTKLFNSITGGKTSHGLNSNTPEQPIDSLVPMSKISNEEKSSIMKMIARETESDEYLHPMQSIFLGSDRRYNRYWLFLGPCDDYDPGHRRIYFESSEDGHWEVIDTLEALHALLSVLDHRGAREARLIASLDCRKTILCQAMSCKPNENGYAQTTQSDHSTVNICREDSSSPVSDVDNRLNNAEIQDTLHSSTTTARHEGVKKRDPTKEHGRTQAFDAWIWKKFYSELNCVKKGKKAYLDSLRRCDHCQDLYWRDEKHCRICHVTFELDFDLEERYAIHSAVCRANRNLNQRVLPSQLQALKAAIYAIESALPKDALLGWKTTSHNLWVNRLRRVSNLREFSQVLADLITAIDEEWFYRNSQVLDSHGFSEELITNFSTTPQTYSAVALWLVRLDLLISSLS